MVSLHGREPPANQLIYSYYNKGNHARRSIPDGICVSRSMLRNGMRAKILPISLTGKEYHNPVIARTTLYALSPHGCYRPGVNVSEGQALKKGGQSLTAKKIADLRLFRKKQEGSRHRQRRIKREIKQSLNFLREKTSSTRWTRRDKYHNRVSELLPSESDIEGKTSTEIMQIVSDALRQGFDELAPTYRCPGPKGFELRCQKNLENVYRS